MYLFPRLLGVGTFVVILFIVCWAIKSLRDVSTKTILKIYLVLLCLMAFFFIPHEGSDLSRLLPIMHGYANLEFGTLLEIMQEYPSPGMLLIYYILGNIGIDGLLPMFGTFVTYSCVFYIIIDASKRFQINKKNIALVLFWYMSLGAFGFVIGNVKTVMSVAIVALAYYKEMIESNSFIKTFPIYLIGASIHSMGAGVFAICLLSHLFKGKNIFWKIANIVLLIGVSVLLLKTGENYILLLNKKMEIYLYGKGMFSYFWDYLESWLITLFSIYILLKFKNNETSYELKSYRIAVFITFAILIVVGFVDFNIFNRLMYFYTIILIPIILYSLEYCKKNVHSYYNKLFYLALLVLIIATTRGNLCSYKFLEYL